MLKSNDNSIYLKILAVSVGVFVFIYAFGLLYRILGMFSDLILIFVLSWLVSFIFEPLIGYFQKLGLNRFWSSVFVFGLFSLIMILAFVLLIPILINQINSLISVLPGYVNNIPNWANKIFDFILSALSNTVDLIQKIASFVFYLIVIIMMSFYLSVDRENIWKNLLFLVPRQYRDELSFFQKTIDSSFTNFIKTQIIFGILFGLITLVILLLFSPSYAILASVLAGLLTVIPMLGPILAIIPPFLALLPLGPDIYLWVTLVLFVLQQIELNILGPKIIGAGMKMHPLIVLVAFLLGFKLAGIWGSIFAMPVASIISVITLALWPHFLTRIGKVRN